MKVTLVKTYYIEAAHYVPSAEDAGRRLHGHSLRVDVFVEGEVTSEVGWLIDYGDITAAFRPIYQQLDHHCINDIDGLEDGSLATLQLWLYDRLKERLAGFKDVKVTIVGDNRYRPVEAPPDPLLGLPRRLRFTFEAAQKLPQLPEGHKCIKLHGHSYRVEVGANDLDLLIPHLKAVYDEVDHCCVNDVPGLEQATCECICHWIWARLSPVVEGLNVVVVQETESARCIYHGE